MSDIFREVEEDVRRERLAKLWKAYGNYAIAALVLLFAGIAGWQVWQRHDQQEREKVSDAFVAAQRISNPQAAASASTGMRCRIRNRIARYAINGIRRSRSNQVIVPAWMHSDSAPQTCLQRRERPDTCGDRPSAGLRSPCNTERSCAPRRL